MGANKNLLLKKQIFTSASMAASLTSTVTEIQFLDNIGIELVFTGSPFGTFSVQGSVNYAQDALGNVTNAGNWVSVTLSPAPVASGSGDQILIDMNQLSFPWIRAIFTRSSGTGTLNGFICGKSV